MAVITLTINGKEVSALDDQNLIEASRDAGIDIPTLCHLEGVGEIGACRLCLVEVEGINKLLPACVTKATEGMVVKTDTGRLQGYRKQIVELLFAERNHTCSVCVANGHCELQDLAISVGMDHSRYEYLYPQCDVDISHDRFGVDHNRCVLCARCVRVCDQIEGAHTWDVMGRGTNARVITGLAQPWGDADSCTSCGKCVMACPTGALFKKGSTVGEMEHDPARLTFIVNAREKKQWIR